MDTPDLISSEVLQLLRCPETRSTLRLLSSDQLAELNARIAAGQLHNRVGEVLRRTLRGGLINELATLIYPIYDHGPTLIVDEAIPISSNASPNVV